MTLTDIFILPPDTILQPVRELSEELRRETDSDEGDFVVSWANGRVHSKVVNAETAALIHQFERPSTIAHAVARFSRGRGTSAEQLLDDAMPLLESLISGQLLVPADSGIASKRRPPLADEENVDGWTVLRCVQSMEDTEVYQVRGGAGQHGALKIARPGADAAAQAIQREARILAGLDLAVTPRLFGTGDWNGRCYMVIEWFAGADAHAACSELRGRNDPESHAQLARVTAAILDAYALLHDKGVVHGDIHPRNILIDRHYAVKIVDLGLARLLGESGRDEAEIRGGVSFFFEPEFACASLERKPPPRTSLAGEQYGLAALLYLLATGSHYLDFSLDRDKMLRQIATLPARSFSQLGVDAWPDAERHLATALSKSPSARFASAREFAQAWRSAGSRQLASTDPPVEDAKPGNIRKDVLKRCSMRGALLNGEPPIAPTTSVNYGSAGIAHALHRIACASDDAELLALADVWSMRSVREIDSEGAFYNREYGLTPEIVGRSSLYHSPAGVYVVQALIAKSRGDLEGQCAATETFIQFSRRPCQQIDLTLGMAGLLLGCVFLLDALKDPSRASLTAPHVERLKARGDEIADMLQRTMDGYGPIRDSNELRNLGMAHGWAGLLYAIMCWCAAAAEPLPGLMTERLHQLGDCAEPVSRGLQWKINLGGGHHAAAGGGFMSGWCNGSAGYVFLWTEAHKATCVPRYLELAEGAAWNAWETRVDTGNLCCGLAGQSYALLNLFRHTGDSVWLRRAREVAGLAAGAIVTMRSRDSKGFELDLRPESLYKGDVGVAVLDADLGHPEHAHMPMFERDV
jgi:serine/threonine-protein kinase